LSLSGLPSSGSTTATRSTPGDVTYLVSCGSGPTARLPTTLRSTGLRTCQAAESTRRPTWTTEWAPNSHSRPRRGIRRWCLYYCATRARYLCVVSNLRASRESNHDLGSGHRHHPAASAAHGNAFNQPEHSECGRTTVHGNLILDERHQLHGEGNGQSSGAIWVPGSGADPSGSLTLGPADEVGQFTFGLKPNSLSPSGRRFYRRVRQP
jgi:hypothetical protein